MHRLDRDVASIVQKQLKSFEAGAQLDAFLDESRDLQHVCNRTGYSGFTGYTGPHARRGYVGGTGATGHHTRRGGAGPPGPERWLDTTIDQIAGDHFRIELGIRAPNPSFHWAPLIDHFQGRSRRSAVATRSVAYTFSDDHTRLELQMRVGDDSVQFDVALVDRRYQWYAPFDEWARHRVWYDG